MPSVCDALPLCNASRGHACGCVTTTETCSPRTEQHSLGAVECTGSEPPLSPSDRHATPSTTAAPATAVGCTQCALGECALAANGSSMRQGPDESGDETLQRDATSPHAPLVDGKHAGPRCTSVLSAPMMGSPPPPGEQASPAKIRIKSRFQYFSRTVHRRAERLARTTRRTSVIRHAQPSAARRSARV